MRKTTLAAGLVMLASFAAAPGGVVHAQASQPAANTKPADETVTVLPGDYMDKIATDHGTTYQRVFDANPSVQDPDIIQPGEMLRIPQPNEQLPDRPLPNNAPAAMPTQVVATPTTAPASYSTAAPATAVSTPAGGVWDRIAQCESGGNWNTNTGNGYYGGLQFTQSTWNAHGGTGNPANASRQQQIAVAQNVAATQGYGAWPVCSGKAGV